MILYKNTLKKRKQSKEVMLTTKTWKTPSIYQLSETTMFKIGQLPQTLLK